MSNVGKARSGTVFRNVVLDPHPRVLGRPTAPPVQPVRTAQNGAATADVSSSHLPSPHGAPSPMPGTPEKVRTFDEGYRAGLADAEVAQRAKTQDEVHAIQRRAFEQGQEEGRQRGLADGQVAGRQLVEREAHAAQEAVAARIAQLDRLLTSLPAELVRRLEVVEDDMVALCHAAVCRILGEELVTPEGVVHQVRQAIRETGASALGRVHGQIAIHVHPRDLATLEADAALAAWLRQHASAGAVHWVADERVKLGGCLVRSAEGSLDARLETQLAALHRLFVEKQGDESTPAPRHSQDGATSQGERKP